MQNCERCHTQGARFLFVKHTKNGKKYTKQPKNIQNGHENIPTGREIHQKFHFQGLPKYTKFGILGMQIYHLAALVTLKIDGNS
jgi:hypothetical protein